MLGVVCGPTKGLVLDLTPSDHTHHDHHNISSFYLRIDEEAVLGLLECSHTLHYWLDGWTASDPGLQALDGQCVCSLITLL